MIAKTKTDLITFVRGQLQQALNEKAGDEFESQLTEILTAVRKWNEADIPPYSAELQQLGLVWQPDHSTANNPTMPDEEEVALPSEAPKMKTEETPPDAVNLGKTPTPQPEARELWLDTVLTRVSQLTSERNYAAAIKVLDENLVRTQILPSSYERLSNLRQAIQIDLEKATQGQVAEAKRIAQSHPSDTVKQRNAWNAVLAINPNSGVAQQALVTLRQQGIVADYLRDLKELLRSSEQAIAAQDLPMLNRELARAQAIELQAQEAKIEAEAIEDIVKLIQQIIRLRDSLREKLGVASTIAVQGDLKGAYLTALDFRQKRVPVLIDTGNVLGHGAEAEVNTDIFYKFVAERYSSELRTKIAERLSQARDIYANDPLFANKKLDEARKFIGDSGLSEIDQQGLTREQQDIKALGETIAEPLRRYQIAQTLVTKAETEQVKVRERIAWLVEARETFPAYPNIAQLLQSKRDLMAAELTSEIGSSLIEAQKLGQAHEYDQAQKLLSEKRDTCYKDIPNPAPESAYAKALLKLDGLQGSLLLQQGDYTRFKELIQHIKHHIDLFDKGDISALQVAREQLKNVAEAYKTAPEATEVISKVTARMGDNENWQEGSQDYRARRWKLAEDKLFKVSQGNSENSKTALAYANRARAALLESEASALEKSTPKPKLSEAYEKYLEAKELFDKHGSDENTSVIELRVKGGYTRLEEIQKQDQEVQMILQQAENLLKLAVNKVARREDSSVVDKTQPVPEFTQVANLLDKATQNPDNKTARQSFLGDEIEDLQRRNQREWRASYLSAIEVAQKSGTNDILKRGYELAQTLEKAGLLYEEKDKELLQTLGLNVLDIEYEDLTNKPDVDLTAVEQNCKARIDALKPSQLRNSNKPKEIVEKLIRELTDKQNIARKQWEKACRDRIAATLNERLRKPATSLPTATRDGIQYLIQELEKPPLKNDQGLIEKVVELCWQVDDFDTAEANIRRLPEGNRGREGADTHYLLREVWIMLNQAAREYANDEVLTANTIIETFVTETLNDSIQHEDFINLCNDQQKLLQQQHFKRLLKQGQDKIKETERQTNDPKTKDQDTLLLEAANKLSLAQLLNPTNTQAQVALKQLGHGLAPIAEDLCSKLTILRLDNRKLSDVIREGDQLNSRLTNLERIKTELKFEETLSQKIDETLKTFKRRLEVWRVANRSIEQSEQVLNGALTQPQPFILAEDDESGGWNIEPCLTILKRAAASAQAEPEIVRFIALRRQQIEGLITIAQELATVIRPVLIAAKSENFDEVIKTARAAEEKWKNTRQRDERWAGIENVVGHQYLPRMARSLPEHIKVAAELKNNLDMIKKWVDEAVKDYVAIKQEQAEMSKDLDDLVHEYTLRDIEERCKKAVDRCKRIMPRLTTDKDKLPAALSVRSQEIYNKVNEDWVEKITEFENDFNRTIAEAIKRKEVFRNHYDELKASYSALRSSIERRRPPSTLVIDGAKRKLKECTALDPLNDGLKTIKDYLKTLP